MLWFLSHHKKRSSVIEIAKTPGSDSNTKNDGESIKKTDVHLISHATSLTQAYELTAFPHSNRTSTKYVPTHLHARDGKTQTERREII